MKKLRKLLFRIFIILLAFVVALSIYLDTILNKMDREKTNKNELNITEQFKKTHKNRHVKNIALFGVDNDGNDTTSLDEARSDAIKIISLDYDERKIKITSIERDLVVYIPGEHQDYGHLNWAYAFGGAKLALQTLNYNFDLDLENYVTISFGSLEYLVDRIGGVDIYLTNAEINQTSAPLNINGPEGVYTLNGAQALSYSRIRKIDSDFARMDRQNAVITAAIAKMKTMNPADIINVISDMMPYINTNLSNNQIKTLLAEMIIFDTNNIETYKEPSGELFDLYDAAGIGGNYVSSYVDMVKNLHKNIYGIDDYDPSQTIKDTETEILSRYAY